MNTNLLGSAAASAAVRCASRRTRTRLHMRIEVNRCHTMPTTRASLAAPGAGALPIFMKTKILIVEDDPHILLGLEEVLKSEDYDVASCNRGDQALDAVAKHHPALIVLDVMLPGLSGYDICKQLRAKKVATPILMLTARARKLTRSSALTSARMIT